MFQFIRKHQAIGLIFIGIVIVSFVIFFSPNQGSGGAAMPRGALGSINGQPIERGDYLNALREARLAHFLRQGTFPGRSGDWDEQRQVVDRLFLLEEARRLGVTVSDEVVAARIVELPFLQDEKTQTFNRAAYDQLLTFIQREEGLTRPDFEQFIRNEVALQHLVQLGGLSGALVPPREAEARYREGNDQFGAQLVMFSATNHLAEVDLSTTNLTQYYSNRLAEYRIPERVMVRYVKFASSNFLADADQQLSTRTNLDLALQAEYQRRGPEAFKDAQGTLKSQEAAVADLREEFRESLALDAARKKANAFANRLYQMAPNAESVTQLATEEGLTARTSMPFEEFRPPFDMQVPSTFSQAAFKLSAEEPFATPVLGSDGVYVVAFERRLPAEYQPFDAVQARVADAVRRTQSRAKAEAAGREFVSLATNLIADGKSFQEAAAAAGLTVHTVTNFSQSTMSLPEFGGRLSPRQLLPVAEDLQPGAVSPFTPAADGGFVMLLTSRSAVPDEDVQRETPDFLKQLRQFGRFSAFSEWQRKRFVAADVRLPGGGSNTNTPAAGPF